MLKAVSSITNAIGALNYKGTWNANTNSPALASGVGTKGDYYVVGTAGTTTLDGISNWGIGDWAVFNGSTWQRVEGGADLNGVNLSVSSTSTLDGNATFKDNLTQGTAAKGVNFTANTPAAGMTSQLLNWYEEGTWTPSLGGTATYTAQEGYYVRTGKQVWVQCSITVNTLGTGSVDTVSGLPYPNNGGPSQLVSANIGYFAGIASSVTSLAGYVQPSGASSVQILGLTAAATSMGALTIFQNGARIDFCAVYMTA